MKNLLLSNLLLFFVTASLFLFEVSNLFVTIFSIVVIILILVTFKVAHGNILGLGFVFIAYNILMHFGFGIVHFLVSNTVARDIYASWTLAFLKSENYALAILISALAFEAYTIAWLFGVDRSQMKQASEATVVDSTETREKAFCYLFGMLMLAGVLLYFIYFLIAGRMSLGMSYLDYRNAIMKENVLYSWMLVFYPTGLLYVIASAEGKKRTIGIALFVATAVIFLVTGNRGEVFYAVLAALGIIGYQKKKLNPKIVLLLCVIMFVIIPVVNSTRITGVTDGFSLEFASLTDPFLEIGMQIRCLVYSLDGVADGAYELMYGYSYLRPLCTVFGYLLFPLGGLPEIPIDLTSENSDFFGYGFTQVAEGYLNFGIVGAALLFAAIGYLFGRLEFKRMNTMTLCLVGSILAILINLSRNTFIFVPGQVAVMVMLYYAVKVLSRKK